MSIANFILWMIVIAAAMVFFRRMDRRFPVATGTVWVLVVGSTAGVLARFLFPGAINRSFGTTTLLGIGGAIVGGIIGGLFSKPPDGRFRTAGFILSAIGSLILPWAWVALVR